MVKEIYRSRVKYALEHGYELRANLDILREEITQETAVLRTDPSPKRHGSDLKAVETAGPKVRKKAFISARNLPWSGWKRKSSGTTISGYC